MGGGGGWKALGAGGWGGGYKSPRALTTAGVLRAMGVAEDKRAMALLNWSLSAANCALRARVWGAMVEDRAAFSSGEKLCTERE